MVIEVILAHVKKLLKYLRFLEEEPEEVRPIATSPESQGRFLSADTDEEAITMIVLMDVIQNDPNNSLE